MKKKNDLFSLKVNATDAEATVVLIVCKGNATNTTLHGGVFDLQVAFSALANEMVNAWVERGMSESEAISLINQGVDAMRIKRGMDKMMAQTKGETECENSDRQA